MRHLKEVNVLGVPYKVNYACGCKVLQNDSGTHRGACDIETREIRLKEEGQPEEAVLVTLLHEVFHIIGIETHVECIANNKEAEDTIDRIVVPLADFLIRNDLIKWRKK